MAVKQIGCMKTEGWCRMKFKSCYSLEGKHQKRGISSQKCGSATFIQNSSGGLKMRRFREVGTEEDGQAEGSSVWQRDSPQ